MAKKMKSFYDAIIIGSVKNTLHGTFHYIWLNYFMIMAVKEILGELK